MSALFPQSYLEWRHCIEVDCAIVLTPQFVSARLQALRKVQGEEVRRFVGLYGERHWQAVLAWFAQAQSELNLNQPSAG